MANYIDEFDRSVNLYKRLRVRLFLAAKTLGFEFEEGQDDFSDFLPLTKDLGKLEQRAGVREMVEQVES